MFYLGLFFFIFSTLKRYGGYENLIDGVDLSYANTYIQVTISKHLKAEKSFFFNVGPLLYFHYMQSWQIFIVIGVSAYAFWLDGPALLPSIILDTRARVVLPEEFL